MNEEIFKCAIHEASAGAPPPFEEVVSQRRHRRLRKVRVGLAALVLIALIAAPFVAPPPHETEIALLTPPTTDWLLETPDPQWVEQLDRHANEEPSHVH
jgi:hypothetical protein